MAALDVLLATNMTKPSPSLEIENSKYKIGNSIPRLVVSQVIKKRCKSWDKKASLGCVTFKINGAPWILEAFLGKGGEGEVYLARNLDSNIPETERLKAVKFFKRKNSEFEMLRRLPQALQNHPNIAKYYGFALNIGRFEGFSPMMHMILMEYYPRGDLHAHLKSFISHQQCDHIASASENEARRLIADTIEALHAMRQAGFAHNDIKPQNFLVGKGGSIVLMDFGLTQELEEGDPEESSDKAARSFGIGGTGTPGYRSVESSRVRESAIHKSQSQKLHQRYIDLEASDVWSLGVVTFQTQEANLVPFNDLGKYRQSDYIVNMSEEEFTSKLWESYDKIRSGLQQIGDGSNRCYTMNSKTVSGATGDKLLFSMEMRSFIGTLLREDPSERPSFRDLHAAIRGDEVALKRFPGLRWLMSSRATFRSFDDKKSRTVISELMEEMVHEVKMRQDMSAEVSLHSAIAPITDDSVLIASITESEDNEVEDEPSYATFATFEKCDANKHESAFVSGIRRMVPVAC